MSERIPLRMAVQIYDTYGYVGLFWTDDVSAEGLFLHASVTDRLKSTILRLRFDHNGASLLLRGTAVREVPGQGVGVQLAFWRCGDEAAHAAYRELIVDNAEGADDPRTHRLSTALRLKVVDEHPVGAMEEGVGDDLAPRSHGARPGVQAHRR